MNEDEWLASRNPYPLLQVLGNKASDRKLRLFSCGCCRLIWRTVPVEHQKAVEMAERLVDEQAIEQELHDLQWQMHQEYYADLENDRYGDGSASAYHTLSFPAARAADNAFRTAAIALWVECPEYHARGPHEETPARLLEVRASQYARQAGLIRCIFGNPFRAVTFDPSWRTPTVTALAQAIYAERYFRDLPILADALEEAGCTHQDILGHCRGEGPHVRGCWAVDRILGKQ